MKYLKNIDSEINFLDSLKGLVEVYGEIASVRMMKIRGYVLMNRDFLASINSIFQDVLKSYSTKLYSLFRSGRVKAGERITFLGHNGKTVSVFISANTGFYGDIVQRTFTSFLKDIQTDNVEVTIIGRLGLSLFLGSEPNRPYTYYELPDYGVDSSKLAEVIKHLVQYDKIKIYYGRYYTVVTQRPEISSISAGTEVSGKDEKPEVEYVFEPTMENILKFFETEIFASLLDQSIRESQLAKFASRIMAMDKASENIKSRIKRTDIERLRMLHTSINSKQLNSLAHIFFISN
jgi:F-type H+-transporting ATPase subunit gamma